MPERFNCEYLIVGGGLSGLACASILEQAGADWLLVEGSSELGGRVKTDRSFEGYLLDRGFQVLTTSYPALSSFLDLKALKLRSFAPGAEVYWGNRFHRIGDPLRKWEALLPTLVAPVGSLSDKLKILKLVKYCLNPQHQEALKGLSTEEFLSHFGFSQKLIDRFFRPFFGGVFLEEQLSTSAQKFVSLFSYFSRGLASLPADGMQAVPEQIASRLPAERIKINSPAVSWKKNLLETKISKIKAKYLILASWEAQNKILGLSLPPCHSAHSFSFSAPSKQGFGSNYLRLNGSSKGFIQSIAFVSSVQKTYAPLNRELVTVSTRCLTSVGIVLEELCSWFGDSVKQWEHLKTDDISRALPVEQKPFARPDIFEEKGFLVFCSGDHTETGSIQGALSSGRKVAQLALGSKVC